jgi:hypothetical protein
MAGPQRIRLRNSAVRDMANIAGPIAHDRWEIAQVTPSMQDYLIKLTWMGRGPENSLFIFNIVNT